MIPKSLLWTLHQDYKGRPNCFSSQCFPRNPPTRPATESKGQRHRPEKQSKELQTRSEQTTAKKLFIVLSHTDLFNPLHESLLLEKKKPKHKSSTTVKFSERVRVKEIPSHRDMDQEEKNSLWMSWDEAVSTTRRNTMEYLADGADWRQAKEEDQFRALPSGELVHPLSFTSYNVNVSTEEKPICVSIRHAQLIVNPAA
jgi:hypothetical protein